MFGLYSNLQYPNNLLINERRKSMRGEGIVPVMEVGNNGGFGNGLGNTGDWAWIIILFLIFGLGGNRGFGNGFGGGSGIADNYVLATDFATIERKLDGVNNGLCDGFYSMAQQFSNTNQNIFQGTASLQQTLCQGFNGLNVAYLQGTNALTGQLADCCCKIERGIDGINYNNALQTSALQQTLCNNTRDIIENANANYRAIHEELVANKLEMKNDRIAEQQNEINALRLKASQEAQNNYLVAKLGPKCPEPAYVVNGPTPVNFPTNCCNTFSGFSNCGCGNY